jgi:hypothetical protein
MRPRKLRRAERGKKILSSSNSPVRGSQLTDSGALDRRGFLRLSILAIGAFTVFGGETGFMHPDSPADDPSCLSPYGDAQDTCNPKGDRRWRNPKTSEWSS